MRPTLGRVPGTSASSASNSATFASSSVTPTRKRNSADWPRCSATRSSALAHVEVRGVGTEHIEPPSLELPRPIRVVDCPCHYPEPCVVRRLDHLLRDRRGI